MTKQTPLAFRAAIPRLASAIKVGGEEGEPVRITLDLYPEGTDIQQLMNLRGSELFITLQEAP